MDDDTRQVDNGKVFISPQITRIGAVHSAHGLTPMQRWIDGASRLRTVDVDEADELFLFETHRKVRKNGTFSLSAKRFETDSSLAGKQVLVRYDPITLNRVDVWFEQQFGVLCQPVSRTERRYAM